MSHRAGGEVRAHCLWLPSHVAPGAVCMSGRWHGFLLTMGPGHESGTRGHWGRLQHVREAVQFAPSRVEGAGTVCR